MMDGKGEDSKAVAAAIGRIPSGLFIVTARRGEAETGLLASWVQQCSFEPLQISVAVRQGRPIVDWLTPDSSFVVNILEDDQPDLLVHFGKGFAPGDPAFIGLDVQRTADGTPVLTDALAYLDCRMVGRCTAGDHDLVIGRVVGGRVLSEGRPMV